MAEPTTPEKQCRICLDGEDLALGRLIRPCLCKGSMSVNISVHDSSNPSQLLIYRQFVHVGCLKRWRDSSPSKNFFSCPVCHYQYRLGRTRVVGIATNPGNYICWPPRVYLTYQPSGRGGGIVGTVHHSRSLVLTHHHLLYGCIRGAIFIYLLILYKPLVCGERSRPHCPSHPERGKRLRVGRRRIWTDYRRS